jgi:hypothetical protein
MSGARSIDPEDMPALFGIVVALCAPYSGSSAAALTASGLGLAWIKAFRIEAGRRVVIQTPNGRLESCVHSPTMKGRRDTVAAAMDCGNRIRVVLLAPSKAVADATDGTDSNRLDVQVRISRSACTHLSL